jgi:hypothetical protein
MGNSSLVLFSHAGSAWVIPLLIIVLAVMPRIGATKVDMIESYQDANANAVSGGELSMNTKIVLQQYDLVEEFRQGPALAISHLHWRKFLIPSIFNAIECGHYRCRAENITRDNSTLYARPKPHFHTRRFCMLPEFRSYFCRLRLQV